MQDIFPFIQTHWQLALALGCILVLLVVIEFIKIKKGTSRLTPAEATQKINHENAVVVDIRNAEAFNEGHIVGSLSIPLADLEKTKKIDKLKTQPIILVCAAGAESPRAATALQNKGFIVYTLNGGIRAWRNAEMPLKKN